MNYLSYYRQDTDQDSGFITLDIKSSDVNGDGVIDEVYLIGDKPGGPDTIVISNISIVIKDGKTKQRKQIDLSVNKGYSPKIFLGSFSNKKADDILVSISSGNTGREGYFYIYSFLNNKVEKLFDFEEFNDHFKYDVIYKDNYIVNIISKYSDKQFTIDLSNKNHSYLTQLYNKDGKLKEPLRGIVSPINELHPVVSESNNAYDLYATQRVVGYYNADTLGMMVTPLRWNGKEFAVIDNNPYLTLFGSDISLRNKDY